MIGAAPHASAHLANHLAALASSIAPLFGQFARAVLLHVRGGAQWISRHTGFPAVLSAALLIVISWRLARKMARVAVEVCVVTALLLALTKLGVVSW